MSILFSGRGGQREKVSPVQRLLMGVVNHVRQAIATLGALWRTPLASLMTIAVLGLSITLPSTLYILVKNTDNISAGWQQAAEISVFLQPSTSLKEAEQFRVQVSLLPEVDEVQLVTANQALAEFQRLSGLADSLSYLDDNPLPHLLLVRPTSKHAQPTAAQQLLIKLEAMRPVDFGKVDIEWLARLTSMISIAQDFVWLMSSLLLLSVVLIIGNTIRLNILSQREQIIIMKLVGATDAFIRRPFVYTGIWFGFLGGLLACLLVVMMLWWMQGSIAHMAQTYASDFRLQGLSTTGMAVILLIAIILGMLGSVISVQKHVKEIEPQ